MKGLAHTVYNFFLTRKWYILSILVAYVFMNIFVWWYVSTEKKVYYWDDSLYWTTAIDLMHAFTVSMQTGFDRFFSSYQTDYNSTAILPFIPFMAIRYTRKVYLLLIANLYILPAAVLFATAFYRQFAPKKSPVYFAVVLMIIVLFPPIILPMLIGMIDSAGLVVMGIILLIIQRWSKLYKSPMWVLPLMAVLLCLLIVVRRWYSYWVVCGVAIYGVAQLATIITTEKKDMWIKLVTAFLSRMLCLVSLVAGIIYIGFPYIFKSFFVNYAELYSAYSKGGVLINSMELLKYFGGVTVIISVIGYSSFIWLTKAYRDYRRHSILILAIIVQALCIFFVFTRTQSFGPHHYYLLAPAIVFGILLLFNTMYHSSKKLLLYSIFVPALISYFFYVFIFSAVSSNIVLGHAQPPLVRHDLKELNRIADDLNLDKDLSTTGVYVLSSSDEINDSILRNVKLPEYFLSGVLPTAHVDKRDGFPGVFFSAKYVITTTPVQTHLPSGQQVITVPSELIAKGEATNLKKISNYRLDNGVEVNVYLKEGPYPEQFMKKLKGAFIKTYGSQYPKLIPQQ